MSGVPYMIHWPLEGSQGLHNAYCTIACDKSGNHPVKVWDVVACRGSVTTISMLQCFGILIAFHVILVNENKRDGMHFLVQKKLSFAKMKLIRCHLRGLPWEVTPSQLNQWLQADESFFGVTQKVTRKGQYHPRWNNKASAFIFCREDDVRDHVVARGTAATLAEQWQPSMCPQYSCGPWHQQWLVWLCPAWWGATLSLRSSWKLFAKNWSATSCCFCSCRFYGASCCLCSWRLCFLGGGVEVTCTVE